MLIASYTRPAPIFSIGLCPTEPYMALGLESSYVELINLRKPELPFQLHLHDSGVLALKYAHNGQWFISAGKDSQLNAWRMPFGSCLFRVRRARIAGVLSSVRR